MCMKDAMAIDSQGGMGIPGALNVTTLDTETRERLGLTGTPPRNGLPRVRRDTGRPMQGLHEIVVFTLESRCLINQTSSS
ncbi:hypothetical protein G6F65_020477 [Rhizopus arrhizus]|nr:hypothetical protein G6F65_020477 [Rhizopus arrhizus]